MARQNADAPIGETSEVSIMPTSEPGTAFSIQAALELAARRGAAVVLVGELSAEERVPIEHPLRKVRRLTDDLLRGMSGEFGQLYARVGRPSVPTERLLRAQLLQIFFSIRDEHLLMEQLDYNLLFRWFVGFDLDEPVWTPAVFADNRARLSSQPLVQGFLHQVIARSQRLTADKHFEVDWALLDAWTGSDSASLVDGDLGHS